MKKIIFLTYIVYFFNIYSIEIGEIPKILNQGDFFVLVMEKKENVNNISIKTEIAKTQIKIFENNEKLYSLIPANYYTEPGKYSIDIFYILNGEEKNKSFEIEITGTKKTESKLKVREELAAKNSEENRKEMRSAVSLARENTNDMKLWQGKFIMPVDGRVTTGFAYERFVNGESNGKHSGIDISQKKGIPIKAVNNGKVVYASFLKITGNTVIIDHGMNLFSSYSHLDKMKIKTGDEVKKGDIIGTLGNTGFSTAPHLHFTFTVGSTFVDPFLIIDKEIID